MTKKHALRLLNDRFPFFFRLEVRDRSYVMALLDENSNEVDAEYFDECSLRMMWNDPGGGPPVTYPFNGLIEYLHRRPRPWMDYLREKRGGGKSEMYYVGLFRKMWTDKVDEWLETARRRGRNIQNPIYMEPSAVLPQNFRRQHSAVAPETDDNVDVLFSCLHDSLLDSLIPVFYNGFI